jgi:hypothetical protein
VDVLVVGESELLVPLELEVGALPRLLQLLMREHLQVVDLPQVALEVLEREVEVPQLAHLLLVAEGLQLAEELQLVEELLLVVEPLVAVEWSVVVEAEALPDVAVVVELEGLNLTKTLLSFPRK